MNIKRFRELADVIERSAKQSSKRTLPKFSMEYFFKLKYGVGVSSIPDWKHFKNCGTTACIAGFACLTWKTECKPGDSADASAQKILGISEREADSIFCSNWD